MSINQSFVGTAHVRSLAGAALVRGSIDVILESEAEAIRIRMQLHNLRAQDRKFSKTMYKFGDPQHGTSQFDCLETQISKKVNRHDLSVPDKWVLTIRTVAAALSSMTVVDSSTGTVIPMEDL